MTVRRITALAAIGIILIVAIWYELLWSPTTKSLHSAQAELVAKQMLHSSQEVQAAALQVQLAKLPAEQAKGAAAIAALPRNPDIAGMIDEIGGIVTSTGVSWPNESQAIGSTSASASPAATPVTSASSAASPAASASNAVAATSAPMTIALTLSVSGTYGQVMNFVGAIQRLPRLVKIVTLSLASNAPTAATPAATSGSVTTGGNAVGASSGAVTAQIAAALYYTPTALPKIPPHATAAK